MLTQKLFNTQLGGEDGIHSLESQTGLSTAVRECKNKHTSASATTGTTTCENEHPSVRAQLRNGGECLVGWGWGSSWPRGFHQLCPNLSRVRAVGWSDSALATAH